MELKTRHISREGGEQNLPYSSGEMCHEMLRGYWGDSARDLHQWELENQPEQLLQMVPCLILPQSKPEDLSELLMSPVLLCAHLIALVPAGAEARPLLGVLANVQQSGLHIFWDLHHPWHVPCLLPGTPCTWTQYCEVWHAH